MANRFEIGQELLARTYVALEEHGIKSRQRAYLKKENATLFINNPEAVIMMETKHFLDEEYHVYDRVIVNFSKDAEKSSVGLVQGKRKKLKSGHYEALFTVSVDYSPMNEHGEANLYDSEINVAVPGNGLHVYSSADKTVDWRWGMSLLINENEAADALIVREDYNSEGFVFPFRLNIYDKLREVQGRFEVGK